ncbi:MAG: HIT family protein [Bacteroidales bacterium]|nr:HIT family protein [Bacteroidales bacterium]
MSSVFSKIVSGEIPCYKIAENENYLAFFDINPIAKGHTLVIPKHEIDYVFDMDDDLYSGLWVFAKKVALAIEKVVPCTKIGVAVIGLEVAHAHIHLVPINGIYDIDFSKDKLKLTSDEFLELATRVSAEVQL